MRVQEFLNTSDVKWEAVFIYTESEDYEVVNTTSGEVYVDMRDIPEKYLKATIDRWDYEEIEEDVPYLVLLVTL